MLTNFESDWNEIEKQVFVLREVLIEKWWKLNGKVISRVFLSSDRNHEMNLSEPLH